eukprot:7069091-Alexandrium_andersonii.AAC.1
MYPPERSRPAAFEQSSLPLLGRRQSETIRGSSVVRSRTDSVIQLFGQTLARASKSSPGGR